VAAPIYGTRKTSPADVAWRRGDAPDSGTLGEFREADADPNSFRDGWVAKMRDNPDYRDFYIGAKFPDETAAMSQQKIDIASQSAYSNFLDPQNKFAADRFLDAYSLSVQRGLIEPEKAVFPENLRYLATESATSRINDENVKGEFPSKGVSV
jgi:hypothetical protein